ncbi:carboxyl-terminal-processing peptidase 1, chloroplastic isoform X5 [Elaeis guineensis]|uniref:C-terminal processing peptidase n=1 Tax=Elaeis guineensis var. tenera TaxID=51953 RepID=A0A8N4IGM6_ELAGV|nr:carboxyl-terminal-processing peptidase 1, chloroplastic isoform X5 [Elaeis guineensis]
MSFPLSRCHRSPQPPLPFRPPPITTKRTPTSPFHRPKAVASVSSSSSDKSWRCLHKLLLQATAGALSFSLLASPFRSLAEAAGPPAVQIPPPPSELCHDWAEEEEVPPESITNEALVEEAWDVVNESFLGDAVSRSWSPEKWLFSKMSKYDVTGIGINLREVPDDNGAVKLKVLGIILDGPAHSAGVRQGDELLSVNGVNVRGRSAFDVSSMLQGPKETFVTIEVKHGNCGPIQSIKVQRQLVARTPVFYRLEKMENGDVSVGYIHIKEFNALAKRDLVIALKHLLDSGASYVVLDLRDNLGGLVQAGIEVAKLFLKKGETVTYTVGRDPHIQKSIVADAAPFATTPLIFVVQVLVNKRTASASEIVATALHDNCKAVLVGERTYGKGLIQSVFELHDGSGVVVTIGKYVTPNHMDINGNGVEPDFPRLPALSEVRNYLSHCQTPLMG